ncbi:hypothetical protein NLM33_15470 [Bradyrhizobium sp. CCGUVB1N3]|uniref:hypothetical protein n=1 Tax=Bradyrhizobium sp. CCGUVB1N3 TaxID=2949629 RepID=UPI0020B2A141|nr:hypothetical protein [Bradyrhizobium sp. CCGUVB1N3]MCP3471722.1 hypothetical protein [Bradyrhizobium sp. CCGUVB1N3]
MIVANDFAAALVGLTPSRRHSKIVKPRLQHNPAGIHLIFAGRCPNNRGQLLMPPLNVLVDPALTIEATITGTI